MNKYITVEDCREMWAKLPVMSTTLIGGDKPFTESYEGIHMPPGAARVVELFKTWEVREDDAWIVSYPKAGTTWAQEIMSCVMLDGDLVEVNKRHTSFRVLYLEFVMPESIRRLKNLPPNLEIPDEMPSPRVLKSHLPGPLLPAQIWEKKPKIVYVMRNPKDVVVSFFYFAKAVYPTAEKIAESFGEWFQKMFKGEVEYGPWWDHYLYFWKRRHDQNILLLRFEDMKRDLRGNVEKISKFLGKNLSAEKLDAITEHCTFANMKKNPMANQDSILFEHGSSKSFMRKGKVGDWKSHFTVAQNEAMDALMREKLHGTGLTFDY